MALGDPIKIRLSVEKALIYEADAAARSLPLGTYLRERLEAQDDVLAELSSLRRLVERGARTTEEQDRQPAADRSAVLELLLLVRTLAGPAKVNLVQQEIKRLGFPIWDGTQGG